MVFLQCSGRPMWKESKKKENFKKSALGSTPYTYAIETSYYSRLGINCCSHICPQQDVSTHKILQDSLDMIYSPTQGPVH